MTPDVLIVAAGLAGFCCAWRLHQKGTRLLIALGTRPDPHALHVEVQTQLKDYFGAKKRRMAEQRENN